MKKVIIGHRGTGKSAFLLRHAGYFPNIRHFDLDAEIEKHIQCSIQEYFKRNDETAFRRLEQEIFGKLTSENTEFVIAVGGGFNLTGLPPELDKVFIRRATDADGRIFIDRPRLQPELSPLAEYNLRYKIRQNLFLQNANSIYDLPEGLNIPDPLEQQVVSRNFIIADAFYTLSRQDLSEINTLLKTYLKIELRTDLLTSDVIHWLLAEYPDHQWLVSIRSNAGDVFSKAKLRDVDAAFYFKGCQILSSHADAIEAGIRQLGEVNEKVHLKLSPLVESFEDLKKGHEWQQADSENRSFLPRSVSGKWLWFRHLSKYMQQLNFLRNFTSALDQPTSTEWLLLPAERPQGWAAVLGSPIHHSHSPKIHKSYFADRKTFFTRVEMTGSEIEKGLKFVVGLGLKYAAVTSPLKELVYSQAEEKSEMASQFESTNTVFESNGTLFCENTDLAGFSGLVKNFSADAKVAVWGGGGTLKLMQAALPEAYFYSSRTGRLRNPHRQELNSYDYLIWAAPRLEQAAWPGVNLSFNTLVDLNYTANSSGLEFAANRKIGYINGLEMLELQAEKQQDFWSQCERK